MNIMTGAIIGGVVGAIVFRQIMGHIRYKKITKTIDKLEQNNKEMRKWLKATGVVEKC